MTDQRCVRFFYWGTRFCCEMINALWFSYSVCFKYLERPNKQKKKKTKQKRNIPQRNDRGHQKVGAGFGEYKDM